MFDPITKEQIEQLISHGQVTGTQQQQGCLGALEFPGSEELMRH